MGKISKLIKILFFTTIGLSLTQPISNSEIKYRDNRKIIVLDPGHGMSNEEPGIIDWGDAIYKNYKEANLVLQQAETIKKMLNPFRYKVILTRKDNFTPTPVESRPELADSLNADLFVSLHLNNFRLKRINGFEIYYEKDKSKKFAELTAKNLEKETPIKKRRIKKEDYKMLKNISCPAVLVESGYLSNKNDRKYILDTIPDIEKAIAKTIEEYFSVKSITK